MLIWTTDHRRTNRGGNHRRLELSGEGCPGTSVLHLRRIRGHDRPRRVRQLLNCMTTKG